MKNILKIALACLFVVSVLGSCSDAEGGVNKVTYYPVLELLGDEYMYAEMGRPYEEPGYTCTLNGEDYTDKVEVSGTVDTNTAGLYELTYTATNSDGFSVSTSRYVFVKNPSDKFGGIYYNSADSYRNYGGTVKTFGAEYLVLVIPTDEAGVYKIDDLFGGWYAQRAGYGSSYAMTATATFTDDGTMTVKKEDTYVAGWGDGADEDVTGTYDDTAKTLTYKVSYAGAMYFQNTLVQK